MRQRIENIIKDAGLISSEFYIGTGATSDLSEIHLDIPKRIRKAGIVRFAIQYCANTIAFWEIGKRLRMNASTNMYWEENVTWKDVENGSIQKKLHSIKGTDESTLSWIVPIETLRNFLLAEYKDSSQDGRDHENGGDEFDHESEGLFLAGTEGNRYQVFSTRIERDPNLRENAISIHGTKCQICGFSYSETYGELGDGYIEVHHTKPISEGIRETDPQRDLVCVCSNCHKMIHRNKKVRTVEQMKLIIEENKQSRVQP